MTVREHVETEKATQKIRQALKSLVIFQFVRLSMQVTFSPRPNRNPSATKKCLTASKPRMQVDPAPKFSVLRFALSNEKSARPEKVLLIRSRAYNSKGSNPNLRSTKYQVRDERSQNVLKSKDSQEVTKFSKKTFTSNVLVGSSVEDSQRKLNYTDFEERFSVPVNANAYFPNSKAISHSSILEVMCKYRLSKVPMIKDNTDSALDNLFPLLNKHPVERTPSSDSQQLKGCTNLGVDQKSVRFTNLRLSEVGRSLPSIRLTK